MSKVVKVVAVYNRDLERTYCEHYFYFWIEASDHDPSDEDAPSAVECVPIETIDRCYHVD